MTLERRIVLHLDDELKRVLVQALEKYEKELAQRELEEHRPLSLVLIAEEKKLVRRNLKQIHQQWNRIFLPTIAQEPN